jgi:hypothetical protein
MSADNTYPPGTVQRRQDGNIHVPTGQLIDVETGGKLTFNDVDVTSQAAALATKSTGTARGTVAATGSTVADAAAVPSADFVSVTAGDGTKGVILLARSAGASVRVKNAAAAVLKVYPPTGAAINGLAANGAISLAANTIAEFIFDSATQLYTLPLLPS